MAKKNFEAQSIEKKSLGGLICELRTAQSITSRRFSSAIGIPTSNLTYIENGTNVPTAETYARIIKELAPPDPIHRKMDELYSKIRKTPPPDICNILLQNYELGEAIRTLENVHLSPNQMESVEALFASFKK